jgi:hypothetical protein
MSASRWLRSRAPERWATGLGAERAGVFPSANRERIKRSVPGRRLQLVLRADRFTRDRNWANNAADFKSAWSMF